MICCYQMEKCSKWMQMNLFSVDRIMKDRVTGALKNWTVSLMHLSQQEDRKQMLTQYWPSLTSMGPIILPLGSWFSWENPQIFSCNAIICLVQRLATRDSSLKAVWVNSALIHTCTPPWKALQRASQQGGFLVFGVRNYKKKVAYNIE